MKTWIVLLAMAGCGRYGYDPTAGDVDAAVIDAGLPDAQVLGPFSEPQLVTELSMATVIDDDPSLSADMLEIYFKSNRSGGADIWRATRLSVDEPFGEPQPVTELNTNSIDDTPELGHDGLTLYLASDRPGGDGATDIFRSTRMAVGQPWTEPERIAELSSPDAEYAAVRNQTETRIVINRLFDDSNFDLMTASSAGSSWSEPVTIAELSTVDYEADAHLDPTGTVLYFTAVRPGSAGRDIYRAVRPDPDSPFGEPERLVELASEQNDEDPWVSPDGRTIFFSSNRTGDSEIYWAAR